ncbi:MAG: Gfo/Idh/MocA family oxidoreductase [Trueperaceae bacterium]
MSRRTIGVVMNGVTGRMGRNQHLIRSILAIREQGGVDLGNGDTLFPEPILVGRSEQRTRALAQEVGAMRWTTDLGEALADPEAEVYFDAQITSARVPALKAAIAAGKHVYCEKPTAETLDDALDLVRRADEAGVKHGVVQDKLFLPGLLKLKRVIDSGFLGKILSVRGEFGYWVFEGDWQSAQRPSWNYRKEDGGGIIMDMLPHWRYVLDNLFGRVLAVSCLGATHIPTRWDEANSEYAATADDAAYATFKLEGGVIAHLNSSWAVRVYRDELVSFQVDGTEGSAVAGLRECRVQHRAMTPKPVWNPDAPNPIDFRSDWNEVPDNEPFGNGFKTQWELFLKHVAANAPYRHTLLEGAKGVQLAELGMESWRTGCWLEVPELAG